MLGMVLKMFVLLLLVSLFPKFVFAVPSLTYINPTPDSGSTVSNTYLSINISINESALYTLIYSWDNTNFTYYGPSLVLLAGLNNDSALNENSTQFQEVSLKNVTGGCKNCPNFNAAGKYYGAYDFDGINDYLNFTNELSGADFTNKTLMAWIYPQVSTGTMGIIDKDYDDGSGLYGGYGLWFQSNNKLWWWNHANKDILDTGSLTAPDNTWTHVAVVWDNVTKSAFFYINGRLNSNKTDTTIIENSSRTASFVVGGFRSGSGAYFNGLIDEPQVWNVSMTQQQIYQHYASGLRKHNSTTWVLQVNQSRNATNGLDRGGHTYYTSATDTSSTSNTWSILTVYIFSSDGSVPEWDSYAMLFILVVAVGGFFYIKSQRNSSV